MKTKLLILLIGIAFVGAVNAQEDVGTCFSIGNRQLGEKDYKGAVESFSKVIELDSNYQSAYFARADASFHLKDYKSALEDYGVVLEEDPNYRTALHMRGLVKLRLDDLNGACLDLKKSFKLGNVKSKEWILKYCLE